VALENVWRKGQCVFAAVSEAAVRRWFYITEAVSGRGLFEVRSDSRCIAGLASGTNN